MLMDHDEWWWARLHDDECGGGQVDIDLFLMDDDAVDDGGCWWSMHDDSKRFQDSKIQKRFIRL